MEVDDDCLTFCRCHLGSLNAGGQQRKCLKKWLVEFLKSHEMMEFTYITLKRLLWPQLYCLQSHLQSSYRRRLEVKCRSLRKLTNFLKNFLWWHWMLEFFNWNWLIKYFFQNIKKWISKTCELENGKFNLHNVNCFLFV